DFPAATEGAIDGDQVEGNVALDDRQVIFLLQSGIFQGVQSVHVRPDLAELFLADLRGPDGRLDASLQTLGLFARTQEAAKGGLGLLGGCQDLVLISRDQVVRSGLLEMDVVGNAAVVQDVPLEVRRDVSKKAARFEQLGEIRSVVA